MKSFNPRWTIIALMIIVAAFSRFFLPHNFTPIGALALFGAAYFTNKRWAFILPLAALWASNLVLNNVFLSQYYDGFVWFANPTVYLAFIAIVGLGLHFLKDISAGRVLAVSLGASVLFFAVTNFESWLVLPYPKTPAGLLSCYVAAIPFFWNTLIGDLVFTAVLFGAFELLQSRNPFLRVQAAH